MPINSIPSMGSSLAKFRSGNKQRLNPIFAASRILISA
jgi:hypothetical protein